MENLLANCKFLFEQPAAVAATTDADGTVIDMSQDGGYDGICHIAITGDVTTGCVLKLDARGSVNSDGSSSSSEAVTTAVTADTTSCDTKLLIVDVKKPANRYQFARINRGTANAVIAGVVSILYKGRTCPVTQDTAHVIASKFGFVM